MNTDTPPLALDPLDPREAFVYGFKCARPIENFMGTGSEYYEWIGSEWEKFSATKAPAPSQEPAAPAGKRVWNMGVPTHTIEAANGGVTPAPYRGPLGDGGEMNNREKLARHLWKKHFADSEFAESWSLGKVTQAFFYSQADEILSLLGPQGAVERFAEPQQDPPGNPQVTPPSQPQEAGDAPADWTDRVIQALAACSKQIERRGVIEGSADQGPAERAHMAGCKWLGKYLAVPPVPQAGPALLETPWMQEDFKRLHALHPWPTPEHDALVRIFMAIKGLQAPASPEGKAGTAQAPDLEALEAYFAAVVAGGDPPGQEIAAKAWLTEIRRLRSQGEAPQGRLWEPVVGSEAIAPALDAAGVGEPAPGEPSKWAKTDSAPPRDPKDGLVFGYVNPTQAEPSKDLPVFYYKEESNPPMKHRYSDPTPTKPQGEA